MIKQVSFNGAVYYNVPLDGGGLGIPAEVLVAAINEQAWALVREERDRRIEVTDYTQMPDSPFTADQRAQFAAYRQALRDIPQTFLEPDKVDWPILPVPGIE